MQKIKNLFGITNNKNKIIVQPKKINVIEIQTDIMFGNSQTILQITNKVKKSTENYIIYNDLSSEPQWIDIRIDGNQLKVTPDNDNTIGGVIFKGKNPIIEGIINKGQFNNKDVFENLKFGILECRFNTVTFDTNQQQATKEQIKSSKNSRALVEEWIMIIKQSNATINVVMSKYQELAKEIYSKE